MFVLGFIADRIGMHSNAVATQVAELERQKREVGR